MQTFQNQLLILSDNIEKVIVGKKEVIDLALITLLCRGHLLIEDVPGVGKTMLARSIANSLALRFKRVQFTPDLLPSDITGVSIFNQKAGEFEFKPGPIFTNILLTDEINRATPRAQSSLLESMEELQVTADGKTYRLPSIFMVIATQNPIELQGTYPLPEAQLDRFFMRIKVGYPSIDQEVRVMEMQIKAHPIHSVAAVMTEEELRAIQSAVTQVYIEKSVKEYIAKLVDATRQHPDLILGASPRGSLGLMRASQALALLKHSDFVEPSMVKQVAKPVLAHRMIVKPQSKLKGGTEEKVIEEVLNRIPVPVEK
ncbi:MAG: MoxR family ATPase [Thermodesulfobacteriota bacterium]|nr:MoxR family ATPase [Thermodesulfobacteriota bacterium]